MIIVVEVASRLCFEWFPRPAKGGLSALILIIDAAGLWGYNVYCLAGRLFDLGESGHSSKAAV